MKISQYNLKVEKAARYYSNNPSGNISDFHFVIHGYAQLASDFLQSFEFLSDEYTLIVAPEGLSKFYSKNKPAASWMTKEDRDNEINDYINYLSEVLVKIKTQFDLTSCKKNITGFSQGAHTALRFFTQTDFHFDRLILCSSDFPADADFDKLTSKLISSEMFYLYGNKDLIINGNTFQKSIALLKNNNINCSKREFDGGHIVDKDSILNILHKKSPAN
jgi:predicted esterase